MTTATLERPCGCPPKASTGPSVLGQRVHVMDGITNAGAGGQRVHIQGGTGNWAVGRVSQTVHIRGECGITDTYNRTDQSDWGTSDYGITWSNAGPGTSSIVSDRGRMVVTDVNNTLNKGLFGLPDLSLFDATVVVAMSSVGDGWWDLNFIAAHDSNSGNRIQVKIHSMTHDDGPGEVWLVDTDGLTALDTASNPLTGRDDGTARDFVVRMQRTFDGVGDTTHRAKVWWADEAEPGTWLLEVVELPAAVPSPVNLCTLSIRQEGTAGGTTTVTIDFEDLDIEGVNDCTEE